ncbi:MAG: hypothetical protein FI729_03815 [SAR202 cluster bacterium]|nr:hypothetical protein [SAR202 cluster bacterium]|tara:strand:- start:4172 stop:4624 length:453 start_codon:yes stop_codon:yes gene_type:complete
MIGWILAILGIILFPVGLYFGGLWNKKGLLITAMAALSLTTGLTLLINELSTNQDKVLILNNPHTDNRESREQGSSVYISNCLSCHGANGMLIIDLHEHVQHHRDDVLFSYIYNGKMNNGMPAFNNTLSVDQIWHVINYMRSMEKPPVKG